jgi:hypothetical protein
MRLLEILSALISNSFRLTLLAVLTFNRERWRTRQS